MLKFSPEFLSEERIKNSVDDETYLMGLRLYQKSRIKILELTETKALCVVSDNRPRSVEILLTRSHLLLKCNCSHGNRGLICEHSVASMLFVRDHLRQNSFPQWRWQLNQILEVAKENLPKKQTRPYLLFFSLQEHFYVDYPSFFWRPYIISLSSISREEQIKLSTANPEEILDLIKEHPILSNRLRVAKSSLQLNDCLNQDAQTVTLANVMVTGERNYPINTSLDDFLTLFAENKTPVYLGNPDNPLAILANLVSEPVELSLVITRQGNEVIINPRVVIGNDDYELAQGDFTFLHPSTAWGYFPNIIFPLKNPSAFLALDALLDLDMRVEDHQEIEFVDNYLLDLSQQFKLEGDLIEIDEIRQAPIPRIYLSDQSGELQAQLRFGYGDREVYFDPNYPEVSQFHEKGAWKIVSIHRDSASEKAITKNLSSPVFGFRRSSMALQPGIYRLRARLHPVDFLLSRVPRLVEEGFEVYGEADLKTARVNRHKPTIAFSVSSEIDWFDVQAVVSFGELEVSLKDIRKSLKKQERYIKLADGSIGEIPEEWLEKYRHLWGLAEPGENGFRLAHHQLALIETMLASADHQTTDAVYNQKKEVYKTLVQADFKGIHPRPLPAEFSGELRPYQKAGYDWLYFMNEYRLGGCLADDMGLGKTVQALAFLQDIYSKAKSNGRSQSASLLVAPKSLLVNWQREAARFAPQLRFLEYFSNTRSKDLEVFQDADVVITSYGVMLRDISHLHAYQFEYVILDESQAIKNPTSQTAKAARLLQGRHKLVLTGTPVENSTIELWSQFAFLNPGLLGSLDYFKKEFASPIERKNDTQALDLLQRMVNPFILRRTKTQVAPDLPPRTERILTCDMEPAQRKLYNRMRDYYRGMVLGMLDKGDWNSNPMKILEGLLRLRQISNHPWLYDEKYRGDSGKFTLLFETLNTLKSEGHKVLVFSQFVKMLSLVRNTLDKETIPYAYLDGQTQNRQAQVDLFQESSEIPFFLISLKAGGLGLNLTAADYVIHIDPWWNPAVELQASDRAHRIGQDKPVFVFKLITQNSVEEKILNLQEKKKNLVDQLITSENSFFKSLTSEELDVLFS